MNKKCALLTIEDLSNFESYDDFLIKPFNLIGWECVFVPWESKSVDWDDFDAVIIRSTWDYQQKEKLFFKTLVKISKSKAKLYNPLSVIKWNINKNYLKALEIKNIPIIPTKFFDVFDYKNVKKCFLNFETNKLIIKPSVSANADDTFILEESFIDDNRVLLSNTFKNKEYLVQPFLENIKIEGEYSLIFFGDVLSHVLLKTPKAGDFRVQEEHGGILKSIDLPENSLVDFGLKVIKNLPMPCLYSRIDVVRNNDQFLLMEVELIEPSLYFNMNSESAIKFAKVFDKWHC